MAKKPTAKNLKDFDKLAEFVHSEIKSITDTIRQSIPTVKEVTPTTNSIK